MHDFTGSKIKANYFRGYEAVGGHIVFAESELIFKPHPFNFQSWDEHIEYTNIERVGKRNTLLLVPNGISIFTKDGNEHKFVVFKRELILEFLESKIKVRKL